MLFILENFNPNFRLYVINLGIYLSLLAKVYIATKKGLVALLTILAVFLDLHIKYLIGKV